MPAQLSDRQRDQRDKFVGWAAAYGLFTGLCFHSIPVLVVGTAGALFGGWGRWRAAR